MSELMLQDPPDVVEDMVIHTFFPHATTEDTLPELINLAVPNPEESLDQPFTVGELLTALGQDKPRSAPGHDNITWKDLRNLPISNKETLLHIVNHSWENGVVEGKLKLTIVHPIPKPEKIRRNPRIFNR